MNSVVDINIIQKAIPVIKSDNWLQYWSFCVLLMCMKTTCVFVIWETWVVCDWNWMYVVDKKVDNIMSTFFYPSFVKTGKWFEIF